MARTLWISVDGQPDGPHDEAALARRLAAGTLAPDTDAWHDGLEAWTTLAALDLRVDAATLPAPAPANTDDSVAVVSASSADGEAHEARFAELVKKSWQRYNQSTFATRVDEVLLGALITVMVERGSALIDLTSDGTNHFVRFERLEDRSRVFFKVNHITPNVVAAKVQGHLVSVIVGYGEFIDSFATIWGAVKAEFRSGLLQSAEPGTITVDGDMDTRYVYVQVDLYWDAGDVVSEDWRIDYEKLGSSMDAAIHVLRKYLRGRFRGGKEA
jgi:hypothetical protein